MPRAATLALSLSALLLAVLSSAAHAQIVRYTDERGQSYYVDGVENVPPLLVFTESSLPVTVTS